MNKLPHSHFSKALFLHAWDMEDVGVVPLMEWARATGLDTLCLAASYHSGWFIHPHHSSRHLRWSESGAAYFHPDETLYGDTCLRPPVATMAATENWFRLAARHAEEFQLNLVAWTVGAHNTRLGLAHPHVVQQNAYGDALPHALSIGHDDTRNYLKALCRDIAANYSPYGMQLESFNWLGVRHGHQHERDLTGLTDLERELLSLCFNPETVRKAQQAGIDTDAARRAVKETLEAAFTHAPNRPAHHPQSMAELEEQQPELRRYQQFLRLLAESLILEIRQESLQGTDCKLYLQTAFNPALHHACDGFAVWAYGQSAEQVYESVRHGKARLPANGSGEFHCYIRLGMGVPASAAELREIVLAAHSAGATGVYFYNYSEAPPAMLDWLQPAIQGI
ncbi:MAG: hypothetical protein ACYC46_03300 [Acidobacteriaceae bacterium]